MSINQFCRNGINRREALNSLTHDSVVHHRCDSLIICHISQLDNEWHVTDFILHCFRNATDELWIMAEQTSLSFIRAACIHLNDLSACFENQASGNDMIVNVLFFRHISSTRALETCEEELTASRTLDSCLHIWLPDIRVLAWNAERIGNRNAVRIAVIIICQKSFTSFWRIWRKRTVLRYRMN